MRSRQLYSSVTASIAGTVYFDIPDNTTIRGVSWAVTQSAGYAQADYIEAEISLSSSAQNTTSDAQGIIAVASITSGGTGTPASQWTAPLCVQSAVNCPVKAGTRVYLNVTENGSSTWRVRALVWFD